MTRSLNAIALSAAITAAGVAQPITGYGPGAAARQRELEGRAIAAPSPDTAATHATRLSAEAHVAGTPAQERTRDYVIGQMRAWGLTTEVRTYDVFMPHPSSVRVMRIVPEPRELDLREPAVIGDPTSSVAQFPTVNGYSGVGDVTAPVVYVNYGLMEDYARLDSLGVSVRGRIAIARYGRSFRGIKAREAERRGAVALILYSDPLDDGFAKGDVYPTGAMRAAFGVQRGSVLNMTGDPSTPGFASVAGAIRTDPVASLPRIPVVPMGYGNASHLLRPLGGQEAPDSWQGALAFRYHVGPGPVQARVVVADDRATRPLKSIHNTFGVIPGTDFPDELIVVGAHRDAWGPGAADNVSGTVSVLEAARAIAELVRSGSRPRRTIVFATWDAEEWGLIGSTEHVEEDSARLTRGGVAYLNQDVAAQGPRFTAGGAPSLRSVLRDITRLVPDPGGSGSVYDEWRRATAVADTTEPPISDPGGGSDFAGFYNHLGIPVADWGFGGPAGVYHSQYDGGAWMRRFGDPGYVRHAAAGRIAAGLALRLANSDILPYDFDELALTMRTLATAVDREVSARRWSVSTRTLAAAVDRLHDAARSFASSRDSALAGGIAVDAARRVNASLMEVERALTRPSGLVGRPWYRNLLFAADADNGYSTMSLPSINEAIRANDASRTEREIEDLAMRITSAAAAIDRARTSLR